MLSKYTTLQHRPRQTARHRHGRAVGFQTNRRFPRHTLRHRHLLRRHEAFGSTTWSDSDETPRPPKRGDLIAGRYELVDSLGSGGFGEVWRAVKLVQPCQTVAIKLLHVWRLTDPEALRRFEREAKVLALAKHDHVVAIHEFGVSEGRHYIVMEFVEGKTLRQYLDTCHAEKTKPRISWVQDVFAQICDAVASMHTSQTVGPIVHRDLKPENVMILEDSHHRPIVKLLDFGLARLGERDMTCTGARAGTPEYMAPEQQMGKTAEISERSDVFSLAVMLIELLTLKSMPRPTYMWWALAIFSQRAVRSALHCLPAVVPEKVLGVLAECLEMDPVYRPANARDLHAKLHQAWIPSAAPVRFVHTVKRRLLYHMHHKPRYARQTLFWMMLMVAIILTKYLS